MDQIDTIFLNSGRELILKNLYQAQVGIMLEGKLLQIFVDQIEESGIKFAKDVFKCERPYLINYPKSKQLEALDNYEAKIMCIARFESSAIAQDKTCYISTGAIIWFQDNYAFPIDSDILNTIKSVNWEEIAIDFEL